MVNAATYSNIVSQIVVNNNNGTITISFVVCSNTSNGEGIGVEANYNTNTFQRSVDNLTFLSNGNTYNGGAGSHFSVQITLPSSAINICFQSFASPFGSVNNGNSFSGFGAILPVSFGKISASKSGRTVKLQWEVFSEQNHDYYEGQRSDDGISWASFATVKTLKERSKVKIYETLNIKPIIGINYYSIKQVDLDGTVSYCKITSTYFDESQNDLVVFPNPMIDSKVEVIFDSENASKIIIFDQLGRKILEKSIQPTESKTKVEVSFESQPAGLYLIGLLNIDGKMIAKKQVVKR